MLGAVYCGKLSCICFTHKCVQYFSCNLIINFSTLSLSLPLCLTLWGVVGLWHLFWSMFEFRQYFLCPATTQFHLRFSGETSFIFFLSLVLSIMHTVCENHTALLSDWSNQWIWEYYSVSLRKKIFPVFEKCAHTGFPTALILHGYVALGSRPTSVWRGGDDAFWACWLKPLNTFILPPPLVSQALFISGTS